MKIQNKVQQMIQFKLPWIKGLLMKIQNKVQQMIQFKLPWIKGLLMKIQNKVQQMIQFKLPWIKGLLMKIHNIVQLMIQFKLPWIKGLMMTIQNSVQQIIKLNPPRSKSNLSSFSAIDHQRRYNVIMTMIRGSWLQNGSFHLIHQYFQQYECNKRGKLPKDKSTSGKHTYTWMAQTNGRFSLLWRHFPQKHLVMQSKWS